MSEVHPCSILAFVWCSRYDRPSELIPSCSMPWLLIVVLSLNIQRSCWCCDDIRPAWDSSRWSWIIIVKIHHELHHTVYDFLKYFSPRFYRNGCNCFEIHPSIRIVCSMIKIRRSFPNVTVTFLDVRLIANLSNFAFITYHSNKATRDLFRKAKRSNIIWRQKAGRLETSYLLCEKNRRNEFYHLLHAPALV